MNKGIKNLKPVKTTEEAKARGKQGGIKSGQVKREKKLISQIYAEFLIKKHKLDKGDITGEEFLEKVILKIMSRGDSSSVSMMKEIREATEGNKVVDININSVSEATKQISEIFNIAVRENNVK